MKCFRRAKLLHDSPSRAFAQLFQSITALRDDPGCNDTTEKLPISCAEGDSAAWALWVLSVFSLKNCSCGLQTVFDGCSAPSSSLKDHFWGQPSWGCSLSSSFIQTEFRHLIEVSEAVYGPKQPQSGGDCGLIQAHLQIYPAVHSCLGFGFFLAKPKLLSPLLGSKNNYDHLCSRNVKIHLKLKSCSK